MIGVAGLSGVVCVTPMSLVSSLSRGRDQRRHHHRRLPDRRQRHGRRARQPCCEHDAHRQQGEQDQDDKWTQAGHGPESTRGGRSG